VKVDGKWRRTIQTDRAGTLVVLDQTKLPNEIAWRRLSTVEDTAVAIRDMIVRGAPLIGVTAAYGIALAPPRNPAVRHRDAHECWPPRARPRESHVGLARCGCDRRRSSTRARQQARDDDVARARRSGHGVS
jgi:methylthioribose-1-phosphate isomerase